MAAELTVEQDGSPIAAVDDVGVVLEGSTATRTYALVNTGDATLTITGVLAASGATVTTDPTDAEIEPEAEEAFVLSLDTNVIGERIITVTVGSDDPLSPTAWDLRWEVAPEITKADLRAIRRLVTHRGAAQEIADTMEAGGGVLSAHTKQAIRVGCGRRRTGNSVIAAIESGTDLPTDARRTLTFAMASHQRGERLADDLDSNPEE